MTCDICNATNDLAEYPCGKTLCPECQKDCYDLDFCATRPECREVAEQVADA